MSLTTQEVANGKVLFVHYYKDQLTFGLYGNKKQYSYLSNEEFTNRIEYVKENMQSLEDNLDINLENPFRKLSQHEAYLILLAAHLKGQAIRVFRNVLANKMSFYEFEIIKLSKNHSTFRSD